MDGGGIERALQLAWSLTSSQERAIPHQMGTIALSSATGAVESMLTCAVIQDKQDDMNDGAGLLSNFHEKQVSSSGLFIYVTFSEYLL